MMVSRCSRSARTLSALLVVGALWTPIVAGADERPAPSPSLYERLVDLAVVRPLGLVPIAVAPVGCLLGLPVAWLRDTPVELFGVCASEPWAFTFRRPLGEL